MDKIGALMLQFLLLVFGLIIGVGAILAAVYLFEHPFNPEYGSLLYPIAGGLYLTLLPVLITGYNIAKLVRLNNRPQLALDFINACLRVIKWMGLFHGAIVTIMLPWVYLLADKDDAPGLMVIALVGFMAVWIFALIEHQVQNMTRRILAGMRDWDNPQISQTCNLFELSIR